MIIWTIKLLSNVKQAIAGRNHPYQLAWAVAFGLVLGLVPHGNLIALVWLIVVLAANVNHSMAAVTAILTSFAGSRMDPYSHQVGEYLLGKPKFYDALLSAWQWPLVPWTDLNNTIVLGSFTIAIVAMFPVFVLTYPVFRYLSERAQAEEPDPTPANTKHNVIVVDQSHARVARPHMASTISVKESQSTGDHDLTPDFAAVGGTGDETAATNRQIDSGSVPLQKISKSDPSQIAVETRIDIIRLSDYRPESADGAVAKSSSNTKDGSTDQEPMDEAFRYLLRQLRDSQQRKAA